MESSHGSRQGYNTCLELREAGLRQCNMDSWMSGPCFSNSPNRKPSRKIRQILLQNLTFKSQMSSKFPTFMGLVSFNLNVMDINIIFSNDSRPKNTCNSIGIDESCNTTSRQKPRAAGLQANKRLHTPRKIERETPKLVVTVCRCFFPFSRRHFCWNSC